MISFRQRSYQKELLDGNDIPFEDIKKNMQELNFINRNLGGHQITLLGLTSLINKKNFGEDLRILEMGCGGGDNLSVIKHWAEKKNLSVHLTGVDINPECIAFAQHEQKNKEIEFIRSDYRDFICQQKPHIIFSSLFCHHFSDEELVFMLQWMKENSTLGFFINDLHRHPLAFFSIQFLTRLFSKSYLVKYDAPLSVRRGFKKNDWKNLFYKAGISAYKIKWKWAFRWLVTCTADADQQ